MPTLPYLHYDVFTNEVLAGNQLSVFPGAAAIDPATMQRIAREMNYSETTFIVPATIAGCAARVRIFTPGVELPMAGHPTIGTAFALAETGVIAPGSEAVSLELGIGPVRVGLEWSGERLASAWMPQTVTLGPVLDDREAAARALSLGAGDLHPDLPVQQASAGVPFLFVPLASRAAVDRAVADTTAMRDLGAHYGVATELFLFSIEPGPLTLPVSGVYSRMFAPLFGIPEDPATGSASGPLGAYLVRHGVVNAATGARIMSLQGAAMGRPSQIHIRLRGSGETVSVEVGGESVLAGRAELYV